MTPREQEQLRHAIFRLLLHHLLAALADQEASRGVRAGITEYLQKQIPKFSQLVADEIHRKTGDAELSPQLLASLDSRTLKAEISDVAGELHDEMETLLRERDNWHQP